jgi:hypothetical protein
MKVYKLKYDSQESGIADLIAKGIINEDLEYQTGTIAVVYIGLIVKSYQDEAPIYRDGYHIDIMIEEEMEFENEVFPVTPNHLFAGE